MEIKIDNRIAKVNFLEKKDNMIRIQVDQKEYEVDAVMVGDMVYSLLYHGESFNIEMIEGDSPYKYYVNTLFNNYHVEILDHSSRLKLGKSKDESHDQADHIATPMPAKIVKILVNEGDKVKKGQTLLVVSAMKMEIEHKAPRDGSIKKIRVKEEDTVNVNDYLIDLGD